MFSPTTFSRKDLLVRAKAMKLERAVILAGGAKPESPANPDELLKHPDEARDATKKDYTMLKKRIHKQFDDHQERTKLRRQKLGKK